MEKFFTLKVCSICKGVKAVHKWSAKKLINGDSDGYVPAREHKKYEYTCTVDGCDAKKQKKNIDM